MGALSDDMEEFLRQGAAEGWSPTTVIAYRRRLEPVVYFLGRRGVLRAADTTPADLDAYMLALVERGLRMRSRQSYGSSITDFFRSLQERGRLLANPARDLPVPDDEIDDLPKSPLSEAEVADLLDTLPRRTPIHLRNALHLELLYSCGLRVGESVALDLDHVDLHRRTLHVARGKSSRERVVPLVSGAVAALNAYLAVRRSLLRGPDHGALLVDIHGDRLDHQVIRAFLNKLSLRRPPEAQKLHPHLFRHSIAVHLLRGGADVRYIQQFLGHVSLGTTKVYLRLVPGRLKDDYDAAMPEIDVGLATMVPGHDPQP